MRRPRFDTRSRHVEFVVDKVHCGRFSPSTLVSPANSHSTDGSTLIIIRDWYNRPISGRRKEWTFLVVAMLVVFVIYAYRFSSSCEDGN
jgi:hypothetical protein